MYTAGVNDAHCMKGLNYQSCFGKCEQKEQVHSTGSMSKINTSSVLLRSLVENVCSVHDLQEGDESFTVGLKQRVSLCTLILLKTSTYGIMNALCVVVNCSSNEHAESVRHFLIEKMDSSVQFSPIACLFSLENKENKRYSLTLLTFCACLVNA